MNSSVDTDTGVREEETQRELRTHAQYDGKPQAGWGQGLGGMDPDLIG